MARLRRVAAGAVRDLLAAKAALLAALGREWQAVMAVQFSIAVIIESRPIFRSFAIQPGFFARIERCKCSGGSIVSIDEGYACAVYP